MSLPIRCWSMVAIVAIFAIVDVCGSSFATENTSTLERLTYHNPGLIVDLGVGLWAWPLPIDYDGDGDLDLVVSCPDVPHNGTYFFENPGGDRHTPVFKPGVRIGKGLDNIQVSYVDGKPRVLLPGIEFVDFTKRVFDSAVPIPLAKDFHRGKLRANQWKLVDFDGDGALDVIVGVEDWAGYGWDNAFNERGEWTHEPLHGYVYFARNEGTNDEPIYATPKKLIAGGKTIDVYGMPSPNVADFDSDGDLDLLCGEFIDKFTYFENRGTRRTPNYAPGRYLGGKQAPLRIPLCMMVVVAIDWDHDDDVDLIVGQEDGRVMFIEHTGRVDDGVPQFAEPKYFQQEAADLKFGALVTPAGVDWDGDGDQDLICGNTAGELGFIENLRKGFPPTWAKPKLLTAGGETVRIQAGPNGSIQGPCEAKWGYTSPSVADWDHDGLLDVVVNSIWGKVCWYRNIGTTSSPVLSSSRPVEVEWPGNPPKPAWNWWNPEGKELATQWRTTPVVIDWNGDGLNDLVMLDCQGHLSLFARQRAPDGRLQLLPPQRVFTHAGGDSLQLAAGAAGASGRRKLCVADWDGDGSRDLLVDSKNVQFLRGVAGEAPLFRFQDAGVVDDRQLAGHSTSPTVVDWNLDRLPDLLIGAEDGCLYYLANPRSMPKAGE